MWFALVAAVGSVYTGNPSLTHLWLPAGKWRGSQNAPGATRQVEIHHGKIDHLGTGALVWFAGKVLCEWLGEREDVPGKAVLELGSGTGAVGIFAAGLGASRVLLTDGGDEALLELSRRNIEHNRNLFEPDACIESQRFRWGDTLPDVVRNHAWDFILASDVTYSRESNEPLCATIQELLLDSAVVAPRVVMSHQKRLGDPSLEEFCACAETHSLDASIVHSIERPPEGEFDPIAVTLVELVVSSSASRSS
jgi:predicted nicotinamide N-methyase